METKFIKLEKITKDGNSVSNGKLESLEIVLTAHFGNTVSLTGYVRFDGCCGVQPFGLYNSTTNIGFILQTIFKLLDLSEEDGIALSKIKNIPIRVVWQGSGDWGSKVIGIGNFISDKFIYIEELMKVGMEHYKDKE